MKYFKYLIPLLAVLLVGSLVLNFYSARELKHFFNISGKQKIVKVVDGDTVKTENGQTIRLACIDAPEIGYCYGQESKQKLEDLILNQYVKLDAVGEDKYYRLLAMIYLDNQLINLTMVEEGHARYGRGGVDRWADNIKEEIKLTAEKAKEEEIGIWSPKCRQTENPVKPECNIKGNISPSDGTKTYHFPGCNNYTQTIIELDIGEQWFCTEAEAQQAGYTKALNCP